jgi:formate dehydrogenase subunit gamma
METTRQVHSRYPRNMIRWLLALLLLALVLPLLPYAVATTDGSSAAISGVVRDPGADYWRDVRQRDAAVAGKTQVRGVDTGILVSQAGEEWRQYRNEKLVPYSAVILGGMLGIFVLYYLIRGKIRIEDGRSGQQLRRYTTPEMVVHWLLAISFVLLALSGLILLYGRWALIPLLGAEGFSVTALVCKNIHNYVGLFFTVMVPIAFFLYLRDSLFNLKVDLKWFMRAGGYLGGEEPSAEKVNAGQKAWYWVAMLGGFVLIASGLVLDFPNFQQGRDWLQLAHVIHSIASVGVMAFFIVHLYLATIGVEGALESMTTGHVDANWARQHHDLWYRELQSGQGQKKGEESPLSGGAHAGGVASPAPDD